MNVIHFKNKFSSKISFLTFGLLFIFNLIIAVFLFYTINHNILNVSDEINKSKLEVITTSIDQFIDSKSTMTKMLATDETLSRFIHKSSFINSNHSLEGIEGYDTLISKLSSFLKVDTTVGSVSLYFIKRKLLLSNNEQMVNNLDLNNPLIYWYSQSIDQQSIVFTSPYIDPISGKYVLSLIAPIRYENALVGSVALSFPIETMMVPLAQSNENQVLILTPNQTVYSDSTEKIHAPFQLTSQYPQIQTELSALTINPNNTSIHVLNTASNANYLFYNNAKYPYQVLMAIKKNPFLSPLRNSIIITNTLLIVFMVILSVVLFFVIERSLKPLIKLQEGIHQVSKGHFDIQLDVLTHDEIGTSAMAFNTMTRQLSDMISDLIITTASIHDSITVLANDASSSNGVVKAIGDIVQSVNNDSLSEYEESQNALVLSQAVSAKLEEVYTRSSDAHTKTLFAYETMASAQNVIDILMQIAAVSDLSLRNIALLFSNISEHVSKFELSYIALVDLENELKTCMIPLKISTETDQSTQDCHPQEHLCRDEILGELSAILSENLSLSKTLYTCTYDLGITIDETVDVNTKLSDALEDVFLHCESIETTITEVNNEMSYLAATASVINSRKESIQQSISNISDYSKSNAKSFDEVFSSIKAHTQAMSNIEHQISNLYQNSFHLSNLLSTIKLPLHKNTKSSL